MSIQREIRTLHSYFSVSSWLDHSARGSCTGSGALGHQAQMQCQRIPQVRQASDYALVVIWVPSQHLIRRFSWLACRCDPAVEPGCYHLEQNASHPFGAIIPVVFDTGKATDSDYRGGSSVVQQLDPTASPQLVHISLVLPAVVDSDRHQAILQQPYIGHTEAY